MESQSSLFEPALDEICEAFRRIAPEILPKIVYAAASRRIFSWKMDAGGVTLRLWPEFRRVPAGVAEALVRGIMRRPKPGVSRRHHLFEVRAWAMGAAPCGPAMGRALPPRGAHVDLQPVLDAVRSSRFEVPVPARIGWTELPARHLMGRFERGHPEGLVVVNRLLDSPCTPPWYLDFLVYHELLHAVLPPRPGATRILVHPPEFRRAERRHPDWDRARLFERWASGEGRRVLAGRSFLRGLPKRFR